MVLPERSKAILNMSTPATPSPDAHTDVLELTLDAMQVIEPSNVALEAHHIVSLYKRDRRARPFRLLRTQVAKRLEKSAIKLVGITSATPNAGKSFVAMNLAASLAQVSQDQVFLVDLDLRRGSVAEEIGLEFGPGISDFLTGSVTDLQSLGWRVEGTKLNLLPTHAVTDDSAEMLVGPAFDRLMDELRVGTGRSTVFCDLPPAFANDDAMITMQKLDGYILVVDSGTNTTKQIRNAMSMFAPKPCIGTILNRHNGGLIDSDGYGYGYGYGYDRYY